MKDLDKGDFKYGLEPALYVRLVHLLGRDPDEDVRARGSVIIAGEDNEVSEATFSIGPYKRAQ